MEGGSLICGTMTFLIWAHHEREDGAGRDHEDAERVEVEDLPRKLNQIN